MTTGVKSTQATGARHPILGSLAALAAIGFLALFVLTFVYGPKFETFVQDFSASITRDLTEYAEDSVLDARSVSSRSATRCFSDSWCGCRSS